MDFLCLTDWGYNTMAVGGARLSVIVTAGGLSRRMGVNKLLLPLAGQPILVRTCEVFQKMERVQEIVVTAPAGLEEEYRQLLLGQGIAKVTRVVTGGAERQDSIYGALRLLTLAPDDLVAVHDAARPLITPELVEAVCAVLDDCDGAIPAVAVKDTIKRVDARGVVVQTLVRSELRAVQTPQIFRFRPLLEAYERARESGLVGTDDASLIEAVGGTVRVVAGDYRNLKVTTAEDLVTLEELWQEMHPHA